MNVRKRVDLTGYFDKKIILGMLKFLPQFSKILLYVFTIYIVLIDLKMIRIIQILDCPEEIFNIDIRWSKDERILNMVDGMGKRLNDFFLLKCVICNESGIF